MPEFEVFRRRVSPVSQEPAVTVQRDGVLLLNDAAYTALGAPDAVELLYAGRERVIGLRPADTSTPDAYRVRKPSAGPGALVSGRAFTNFFRIPTTMARRYRAVMRDDVLIINLGEILTERHRVVATAQPLRERRGNSWEEPREGMEVV
jgi:hypothetical protein